LNINIYTITSTYIYIYISLETRNYAGWLAFMLITKVFSNNKIKNSINLWKLCINSSWADQMSVQILLFCVLIPPRFFPSIARFNVVTIVEV